MYRLIGSLVACFLFLALLIMPTSNLEAHCYGGGYRECGGCYHHGYYSYHYGCNCAPGYYHYCHYYYPGYTYAYPYNNFYDNDNPGPYWTSGPGVYFFSNRF